jgi:F-type H+-transporting ATPase subunit gamma
MAISTKAIKTRIRSIGNIQKITKAMEMVAAAKMRHAVAAAIGTRSYAELALELLINISKEKNITHPLLQIRPLKKILILVIAANKGLCGGFNSNIAKELNRFYLSHQNKTAIDFVTVGKKAETIVKRLKGNLVASFIELPDKPKVDDIRALSRTLIEDFQNKKYDQVVMVYTNFISSIKYETKVFGLLPISEQHVKNLIHELGRGGIEEKDMRLKSMALYLFEPSPEEILSQILPQLTEIQIYQAILESAAAEHSARMLAMRGANDSAKEMIDEFTLNFNQARQAAITQEISEIVSGATALQ